MTFNPPKTTVPYDFMESITEEIRQARKEIKSTPPGKEKNEMIEYEMELIQDRYELLIKRTFYYYELINLFLKLDY